MSNTLKHVFQSGMADDPNTALVRPSNWNHEHVFAGGIQGAFLVRQTSESDGAAWTDASMVWDEGIGKLSVDGLQFKLLASPNGVRFTAPAAPTGDHVWTLPVDLGAAGSVLTNDGTGLLSWTLPGGGSILPVASGGTGLAVGVSGGILGFTSTTTMASTGVLTANAPVIGGGAGAVPTVGTRSGNTTAFVTLAGSATSGTCVQFDASGNAASTGAPCGSGGGSGITSLNLALGAAQTFGNDTNVTIATNTGTGVHQLGWTGTLSKARGGSGGTGGATDQVAFWTSTTLAGDTHFRWIPSIKVLALGLPNDITSPSRILTVVSKSIGGSDPAAHITGTFAGADPLLNYPVAATFIGAFPGGAQMPAGFGVTIELSTRDEFGGGTFIPNATISSTTLAVSPSESDLRFSIRHAGVATPLMSLSHGQVLSGRNIRSQVDGTISVQGGTFIAARDYLATTPAANDGVGGVAFTGENTFPVQDAGLANILASVDATGGTRIKGRLTFHTSDGTNIVERMRINADGIVSIGTPTIVPVAGTTLFMVSGPGNQPKARLENTTSGATSLRSVLSLVRATFGGQMAPPFAAAQDFILRDADLVDNLVVRFVAETGVPDNTGVFRLQTAIGGVLDDRLIVSATGQVFYKPTTTVGTFGLGNNGTRRTELQFYTNNGIDVVGFIAPATVTGGSHIWTLPTTVGAANSLLANDGSGNLFWGTVPTDFVVTSLQAGPVPFGGQAAGPLNATVSNSDNALPYQAILGQIVNGSTAGVIPVSIVNDKAAMSGWAFRGAGGTSPIYGGHFGAKYETTGVAIGVEVGLQNNSGVAFVGNGLWVNGSGANTRDNAVLIDTQNVSKWGAGIRFLEGNVGGGATGSILNYGIIFDKSHDADFLVIRPRVGAGNAAIRITNTAFTDNAFIVTNDGRMALGLAVDLFGPAGSINAAGNINAEGTMGAAQYFALGLPGFTGVKVAGSCTITFTGGIVTNVTGC